MLVGYRPGLEPTHRDAWPDSPLPQPPRRARSARVDPERCRHRSAAPRPSAEPKDDTTSSRRRNPWAAMSPGDPHGHRARGVRTAPDSKTCPLSRRRPATLAPTTDPARAAGWLEPPRSPWEPWRVGQGTHPEAPPPWRPRWWPGHPHQTTRRPKDRPTHRADARHGPKGKTRENLLDPEQATGQGGSHHLDTEHPGLGAGRTDREGHAQVRARSQRDTGPRGHPRSKENGSARQGGPLPRWIPR